MKNIKRILSIALAVTFLLVIAVIPASAVFMDNNYNFVSGKFLLEGTITVRVSHYVEAGTMLTPATPNIDPNCMSCIVVTELDGSGYSVAASCGTLSATATYNASSIWDDLYKLGSEHYGAYDNTGYCVCISLIHTIEEIEEDF